MTTRLLLDEMLSPRIAEQVAGYGLDAVAGVGRPDLVQLPDADLLSLAAAERRVLVTLNIADFVALDATWRDVGRTHAGISLVSFASFPQNRGFVGAVVRALVQEHRARGLPGPGEISFLRRAARGSTA